MPFWMALIVFKVRLYEFFIQDATAFTAATLVLWLFFIFKNHGQALRDLFKRHFIGVLLALALSGIIFYIVPVGFKVLSDETNLLSVSRMMATKFQALNAVQGIYLPDGGYLHLENEVPTRPLMFPFLTACLHWILGLRTQNIFTLNFILFSALLFTVYCLFEKKNLTVRLLITTLIAFNASLALHAASAGFDLCSLLFGIWTFITLWIYLSTPSKQNLIVLLLTAITFAQVRYESLVVFVFLAGAVIVLRKKEIWTDLKKNKILLAFPLLLFPSLLQRYLTWGEFENRTTEPAFSLVNIWKHTPEFLNYFFIQYKSAYSIALDILGAVGLVLLIRTMKDKKSKIFLRTAIAYALFILLLLLAHHFGIAAFPTQLRLFMPLSVLLGLAAGFAFSDGKQKIAIFAVFCLLQMGLSLHYFHTDKEQLELGVEMRIIKKYIEGTRFDAPLFIYRRPGEIVALGQSAVTPGCFDKENDRIIGYLKDQKIHTVFQIELSISDIHLNHQQGLHQGWTRALLESIPVTPLFALDVYTLIYSPEASADKKTL